MIELGDRVKCIYTGFTGIAVAKTIFINGCEQISVAPKWDGKSQLIDEMGIDSQSLKIVKKNPIKLKEKAEEMLEALEEEDEGTGGPMRRAVKQRGY